MKSPKPTLHSDQLSHPVRLKYAHMSDAVFLSHFDSIWAMRQHQFDADGKPVEKKRKYEEDTIQVMCVKLFIQRYPYLHKLFFMIKNDGLKKVIKGKYGDVHIGAIRDKQRGLVSGIADMELSIPNKFYCGLYVEFKKPGGKQSDEQKIFQRFITAAGYKYLLVESIGEFDDYLNVYMDTVTVLPQLRALCELIDMENVQNKKLPY